MNTTVIKHQSTGAQAIRIVGLVAVLFLAAALGIFVGNTLRGTNDAPTVGQAATDTTSSSFSLDAIRHLQAARGDAGAELGAPRAMPTTDPRPHLWAPIDSADDNASLTRPTAR